MCLTLPIFGQTSGSCSDGLCGAARPAQTSFSTLRKSQTPLAAASTGQLALFQKFTLAGDYVTSGIGVRGSGNGVITIQGIPSGATVKAAFLYWETLGDGQNGVFSGHTVAGTALGTTVSPCWPEPTITVYRADVLSFVNPAGNGAYSVSFPDSGDLFTAPSTEGASLVIVYAKDGLPTSTILLYDGAVTIPFDGSSVDGSSLAVTISGFPAASSSPKAKLTHIAGDGQPFEDQLFFNGSLLATSIFSAGRGQMWDDITFDVSSFIPPGATQVTTSSPIVNDCLTWGVVVFSIVGPQIQITLTPAPPNDQYVIDPVPTMPSIAAKAKVVGISPDPTPTTTFTWTAALSINKGRPGCVGPKVSYDADIAQNVTTTGDAVYTLTFNDPNAFRGGKLQLTASATVNGQLLTGTTPDDLTIAGTNPQRVDVQSDIDSVVPSTGFLGLQTSDIQDVLKRMACRESTLNGILGQREFEAAANGGIGPVIVSCDNGVGMFQITSGNPLVTTPNVAFNWRTNVATGESIYQQKAQTAKQYPAVLKGNAAYHNLITNTINPARIAAGLRPIPGFPAPPFTVVGPISSAPSNQLLEDAVRGYNGYAGTTPFGTALHEFIPDTTFLSTVPDNQLPGLATNPRVWRRVLPNERPNSGDRNYVNNVAAQSPACGG